MDYAEIARAAVGFLTPYFAAAGGKLVEDGLSVAREKVAGWLKGKFTKPAQAVAIEVATKAPHDADALEALQHQLQRALEQDEEFRKELLKLLPKEALPPGMKVTISGNGNVVVQSSGSGNIHVQR